MISRNERQEITKQKFRNNNYNGLLIATTGYGKTRVSTELAVEIFDKSESDFVHELYLEVIVPTLYLQKQWEEILEKTFSNSYKVSVVNTLVNSNYQSNAYVVIYDEIKRYIKGNLFSKVFELTKNAQYKIGLTPRLDSDEISYLSDFLPVVDTITREEARRNGWIADYKAINWLVDFESQDKREQYAKVHYVHDQCFGLFGSDFFAANNARNKIGAANYIDKHRLQLQHSNGNDMTRQEMISYLTTKANIWHNSMMKRKELLSKATCKIEATKQLCDYLLKDENNKIITFGQLTDTCDQLAELIPNSYSYHSNLKSIEVSETQLGLAGMISDKVTKQIKMFDNSNPIKLSVNKTKQFYMNSFELSLSRCLHTCKALNLGADIKGVNIAITYGRESTKHNLEQTQGRALRKEGNKEALLINIAVKGTKDESWLKSAQRGERGIITVESFEDLIELI